MNLQINWGYNDFSGPSLVGYITVGGNVVEVLPDCKITLAFAPPDNFKPPAEYPEFPPPPRDRIEDWLADGM